MRRSRLLILVGIVLLLGVAALVVAGMLGIVPIPGGLGPATPTPEGPQPTPVVTVDVVVAAQNIPRGAVIPEDQLRLVPWPQSSFLPSMMTNVDQVAGKIARYDIYREQPIHETMVVENLRELGTIGSDAALQIEPGMVAIAVPFTRLSGVAFAIRDGDQIDLLASFLFVDLDQEWQTLLPNSVWGVTYAVPTIDEGGGGAGPLTPQVVPGAPFSRGRLDDEVFAQIFTNLTGASPVPFYLVPSETQRPRLVSQRIVQNAQVLHVGTFALPGPTPEPTVTPAPNEPTPTPPPSVAIAAERPDIITLVVTPQDAVVLNYLMAADVDLTFVLRSAGDTTELGTESVTLQSLIDRFQIAIPAPLEQGLEPPVRDIQPPVLPNDPPVPGQ